MSGDRPSGTRPSSRDMRLRSDTCELATSAAHSSVRSEMNGETSSAPRSSISLGRVLGCRNSALCSSSRKRASIFSMNSTSCSVVRSPCTSRA